MLLWCRVVSKPVYRKCQLPASRLETMLNLSVCNKGISHPAASAAVVWMPNYSTAGLSPMMEQNKSLGANIIYCICQTYSLVSVFMYYGKHFSFRYNVSVHLHHQLPH